MRGDCAGGAGRSRGPRARDSLRADQRVEVRAPLDREVDRDGMPHRRGGAREGPLDQRPPHRGRRDVDGAEAGAHVGGRIRGAVVVGGDPHGLTVIGRAPHRTGVVADREHRQDADAAQVGDHAVQRLQLRARVLGLRDPPGKDDDVGCARGTHRGDVEAIGVVGIQHEPRARREPVQGRDLALRIERLARHPARVRSHAGPVLGRGTDGHAQHGGPVSVVVIRRRIPLHGVAPVRLQADRHAVVTCAGVLAEHAATELRVVRAHPRVDDPDRRVGTARTAQQVRPGVHDVGAAQRAGDGVRADRSVVLREGDVGPGRDRAHDRRHAGGRDPDARPVVDADAGASPGGECLRDRWQDLLCDALQGVDPGGALLGTGQPGDGVRDVERHAVLVHRRLGEEEHLDPRGGWRGVQPLVEIGRDGPAPGEAGGERHCEEHAPRRAATIPARCCPDLRHGLVS